MGQYYEPVVAEPGTEMTEIVSHWLSHEYGEGLKLMEHSWAGGKLVTAVALFLYESPHRLVWAGDYADEEPDGETLNAKADGAPKRTVTSTATPRYLVNHTKGQYLDLADCPSAAYYTSSPSVIHPLSLLTSEGNGRGGGDYRGTGMEHVGAWARDVVSTSDSAPDGMTEIHPDFLEERAVVVPLPESDVLAEFYRAGPPL